MFEIINPFHATDLFRYPLKTSENLWFSDVFGGYQKRPVAWNGLIAILDKLLNLLNLFHATNLFWYPLKTSENLWFSDVFRGYQKRSVTRNDLNSDIQDVHNLNALECFTLTF